MTLREKIIFFGMCLQNSHPSTTQVWLEDVNLQKWYRGDTIDAEESMTDLGTRAEDILVYFYLFTVLASKNLEVITSFLKDNNRILAMVSNLANEKMSQLFTQLYLHFPDLVPDISHISIQEAIYHVLNCLSQPSKTISSSKKRKVEDSLNNREKNSLPREIELSIKINKFFTLIQQNHNCASQLWQDNEDLRRWFTGLDVVINGQSYSATLDQLLFQFEELICSQFWSIVSFISTSLASKFKNLDFASSLKLLHTFIQNFDHTKLRYYLNINIHSLKCVSQCLQNLREKSGIDTRIIAVLESYLRKNGQYKKTASTGLITKPNLTKTSTYKKIKVLTEDKPTTPSTASSSPADPKQPQSPFFVSNSNQNSSPNQNTEEPDPIVDINFFFQN